MLEPHDFLRRLAALAPAPYTHLVRYHGVFANRSTARGRLPWPPATGEASAAAGAAGSATASPPPPRQRRLPWAQLLRRVFGVDALRCPRCARPMVVLALIADPPVVARILDLEEPVGEVVEEPSGELSPGDAPWGDDDEAPP